ncbi:fumarylacetoacetate (FAA) hydrolase [Rhodovulum sp. ES.010]|uniref:fumarylacetoacetate hydrolase family protein n=1 Tax=Rhodovulum sp. ES.010 TaxID=1882821 RepID=UPI000929EB0C|nr:fumarylacetoacetate hydrolase family protein [Rhodovulum sp. ES.010]SIO28543.1 fumarylacetoacetate (FAA) hydrolase [Rhodovulum sp. ES.010]
MKLATLNDGTPDGRLVAVSDDLTTQRACTDHTFQAALDHDRLVPAYEERPFDARLCAAPLPRAYQFLDGSAYVNHVALVRRARGAEMPGRFWTDPLMYQGASDGFLGPTDDIVGDPAWGMDFEAEVAVITGYVPRGASPDQAAGAIRYVMLLNDISLRALIPEELSKGFGFVQSKPHSACAPVAVKVATCPGWRDGRLHGTLCVDLNGAPFGRVEAGEDMTFDFPTLIAHAARTRSLGPGTVVGSGTVSNRGADGGPGAPVAEGGRGYACLAEQRMVETIREGAARTPFLQPGDRVRIWMDDADGRPIFGAIDQEVRGT